MIEQNQGDCKGLQRIAFWGAIFAAAAVFGIFVLVIYGWNHF